MHVLKCAVLVLALFQAVDAFPRPGRPSPVVFIPGNGGSQLEARLGGEHSTRSHCEPQHGWHRIWMDVWHLILGKLDCWSDKMKLRYNVTEGRSDNAPGVETRVPGWGTTVTTAYIDPSWTAWAMGNIGAYAAPLYNRLVSWGYIRDVNLRGAPYDFRYAPHSQGEYFRKLRELVEETFTNNQDTKVTLLAHSMGGLFGLYFLNQQSQEWKDKYVHAYVAVSTPWYGTVITTQVYVSGYAWGVQAVDPWALREEQRTQETAALLLPHPAGWRHEEPLVMTPEKSYTTGTYDSFFEDIEYPITKHVMKKFESPEYKLKDPGVKFYCAFSDGVDTPEQIVYDTGFHNSKRPLSVRMGNGDGTVNQRSLEGCLSFMDLDDEYLGEDQQALHIQGASHFGIFQDYRFLTFLRNVLFQEQMSPKQKELDILGLIQGGVSLIIDT